MGLRVFLTGASGYLGTVLSEQLARLPEIESVTGIGLTKPRRTLPPKVRFLEMDIRSPGLPAALAGHDVVVHTACVVLWPAKMPVQERDDINLNGASYVAQAAIANKVRRFVHASSMAVYDPLLAKGETEVSEDFPKGKGDSPYYYWNGKAVSEKKLTEMLAPAGTVLTCFRPIYIIGPRNRGVVESYRRNAVNILGHNPRRQFVHENDVATAFIQAVFTDMPGPFNVVPDDSIRLSDTWRAIGKKFVPTVPLFVASLITSLKWRLFGSPIHKSWVEDMLVDFTGSNAKLKATGWRPRYTSLEALCSAL